MQISLPTDNARNASGLTRVAAHTHVSGLGLDEKYRPDASQDQSCGIIGQYKARRALGLYLKMLSVGRVCGKALLLAGPPGTGKTALGMAFSKSLPDKGTPFVHITGSELKSLEISKSEALHQALRKATNVMLKETKQLVVGEVVEIEVDRPTGTGSGQKTAKLTLATSDMETVYDMGPKMIVQFQKLNVTAGDIIEIETKSGQMRVLGRSFTRTHEFDATSCNGKYIPVPTGEVLQTKEQVHTVTLHDVDVVNSKQSGFVSLFSGNIGEIPTEIRDAVTVKVEEMATDGRATIVPGVLFLDECHMLDIESFSFLNRAMEKSLSPIIILATNRGICPVRGGGGFGAPHGIPPDFLDRCLIVHTQQYTNEEIRKIITVRAKEEDVAQHLEDGALGLLCKAATEYSLRYALNILGVSEVLRSIRKERFSLNLEGVDRMKDVDHVTMEDVERATLLFSFKSYSDCKVV